MLVVSRCFVLFCAFQDDRKGRILLNNMLPLLHKACFVWQMNYVNLLYPKLFQVN